MDGSEKNLTLEQQPKMAIPDFDVLQKVSIKDTSNMSKQQLKCTCKYIEVYGMPCQHTIAVAQTFSPKWKGMTHHDISVRWWKSYFLYSLPETVTTDRNKQQQIKQVFHALRKHESVGIHITREMYSNIDIQPHPLPDTYKQEGHVVKCKNYPDSNEVSDFDPFHSNLDGTMSQVTDVNTQMESDDEDNIFAFVSDNINSTIQNTKKENSFFSQLKPNFTEAVNWIRSQDEVDAFATVIDKFVSDLKEKYQTEGNDTNREHTYVSSNLPIETCKKHHGCDGWKK